MSLTQNKDNRLQVPAKKQEFPLTFTQRFEAQFKNLAQVRAFIVQHMQDTRFDEDEIYAITMAVDEGFTNIIEHAYGGECEQEIECVCSVDESEFKVFLIDQGIPFDPTTIQEPDISSPIEERQIGGLGIHFIRQNMDEVHFSQILNPDNGHGTSNQLVMVKRKSVEKKPKLHS